MEINQINRRDALICGAALGISVGGAGCSPKSQGEVNNMYGLINVMSATEGNRTKLAEIMMAGLKDMPGCLSYVVAEDIGDKNKLWITEVWTDAAAHKASLQLDSVQDAITKARPLIAGMERISETRPLGGVGVN